MSLQHVRSVYISIHSLHTEGDFSVLWYPYGARVFQSTPSTRRETICLLKHFLIFLYFNPLPPHGGRPSVLIVPAMSIFYFNPLPPHGGRPGNPRVVVSSEIYFNPLPPHGGRHYVLLLLAYATIFQSTPSTRRETAFGYGFKIQLFHFNPLPPHGGRRILLVS